MRYSAIAAAFALLGVAATAQGHHSRGHVDFNKDVEITGTVSRYDFANPHVYVTVDVLRDDGGVDHWLLETLHTLGMSQLGWDKQSFAIGDLVTARGSPNRDPGRTHMMPVVIVKADGTTLWASASRSPGYEPPVPFSGAPRDPRDLAGAWVRVAEPRQPRGGGAPAGERPAPPPSPYNAVGAAALAAMDVNADPMLQCQPGPLFSTSLFPLRIERAGDDYRMIGEFMGIDRVVHMDQVMPESMEASRQGYAVGRWEGESLVVEIDHFTPITWGLAEGLDSSAEMRVVERYTPSADGRQLAITREIHDPVYLSRPLVDEMTRVYALDHEPTVYECDVTSAQRHLEVVDEHAP